MARQKRDSGLTLQQVAQGIGLDDAELRRRVARAGVVSMLNAQGRVPVAALDDFVAKVKAAAAPALGEGLLADPAGLDLLMERSGVRRLEAAPVEKAKPVVAARSAPVRPATSRSSAPTVVANRPPAAPVGLVRSQVLQEQLDDALARLSQLECALREAEARAAAAEAELDRARRQAGEQAQHLSALQGQLAAKEASLHALRVSDPPAPPTLNALLEARGLLGEDEAAAAVRALMQARRWGPVGAGLRPDDPKALASLLDARLVLHCGRESCPLPAGVAPVRVSTARCEGCGGGDLPRALRRLGDTLLLNGLRRVALRGAGAWTRLLDESLDRRVELTHGERRGDVEAPQITLIWRREAPETPDGAPTLRSDARSLAGFAEEIIHALEQT